MTSATTRSRSMKKSRNFVQSSSCWKKLTLVELTKRQLNFYTSSTSSWQLWTRWHRMASTPANTSKSAFVSCSKVKRQQTSASTSMTLTLRKSKKIEMTWTKSWKLTLGSLKRLTLSSVSLWALTSTRSKLQRRIQAPASAVRRWPRVGSCCISVAVKFMHRACILSGPSLPASRKSTVPSARRATTLKSGWSSPMIPWCRLRRKPSRRNLQRLMKAFCSRRQATDRTRTSSPMETQTLPKKLKPTSQTEVQSIPLVLPKTIRLD